MKSFFFFVALAVVAQGCASFPKAGGFGSSVCRERSTYSAELEFFDQAAIRSAAALEGFVKANCKCEAGKFTTQECENAARTVMVVKTRTPWHRAMAMYNSGISSERPPENPPSIPPPETLCPEGEK